MSLKIEATAKTPKLKVLPKKGLIHMSGISIPEDPKAFYAEFHSAINEYVKSPAKITTVEFKLEYFNTSTTLIIRNLIRKLREANSSTELTVYWYYEEDDEDMEEVGEEFKILFSDLKFDIVQVKQF